MRSKAAKLVIISGVLLASAAAEALAASPMYYLTSEGTRGQIMAEMLWGVLVVAVVVVVITSALVIAGVWRRGDPYDQLGDMPTQISRGESGLVWVYSGLVATTLVLIGLVVWTFGAMAAINEPASPPKLTIEVTGHQWWWELNIPARVPRANSRAPTKSIFLSVNRCACGFRSADVIHSFWVPALSGETDLVPGQVNETWIEAQRPGVYRGQCAEFCGQQHAHMAIEVVADPPAQFEAWREGQRLAPASGGDVQAGRSVRAENAPYATPSRHSGSGKAGPDLTHLRAGATIAAARGPHAATCGLDLRSAAHQARQSHARTELSGQDLALARNFWRNGVATWL